MKKQINLMKTLVAVITLFLFTYNVNAQAEIKITNKTGCSLIVHMHAFSTLDCTGKTDKKYIVSAGSVITVLAPANEEWYYTEILSLSSTKCYDSFGIAVTTPMSCDNNICSLYNQVPSSATVFNNGLCNDCLDYVNAEWIADCHNFGELIITDY